MNHRDAELTEVVVVLEELDTERTMLCVEQLKVVGLEVSSVDDEQSLVQGACMSGRRAVAVRNRDRPGRAEFPGKKFGFS